MEFFDSWNAPGTQFPNNEIIGNTDLPAEMSIYANTTIGTSSATNIDTHEGRKNLNIYGQLNLLQTGGTSNLNLDDSGNLTILGNFISTNGSGNFNTSLTVGTTATITTDLIVGGDVKFDDKIFEINRTLQGELRTATEPQDFATPASRIDLSGFMINRGESVSETTDNTKPAFVWSEGLSTATEDSQLSDQFVLLKSHADFVYDSVSSSASSHVLQRKFGGSLYTSGTLTIDNIYKIELFVDGDDFSNVADSGVAGNGATGNVFTATVTTPTVWTKSSILRDVTENDFSLQIADFRANDIYSKSLYLQNHHGVTNDNYEMLPTLADDYYKLEASGYDLNKLHEVFDTVGTDQFNALHGLDITPLAYPADPDYGNGYFATENKTIQWHLDDLEARKVDMIRYFVSDETNTLVNDPLGILPLYDTDRYKPFYIRTQKKSNSLDFEKDSFLAITKIAPYTEDVGTKLQDDFMGGALLYDDTLLLKQVIL